MSVLPATDRDPALRPARHAVTVIVLHWLVFLLMAGAYATMELRDLFPKGSPERAAMRLWHYGLGLSVLAAVFVRVLARVSARSPEVVPAPPAWQDRVAKLAHVALYALMIALPVLGWLALSAEGRPITLAGAIDMAWVTRETVAALYEWAAVPPARAGTSSMIPRISPAAFTR